MRSSIARKILAIAVGLVVLMALAASLSYVMAHRVGHAIDRLTANYIPAYGDLARANVRSLEQALALRRLIIAALEAPPDAAAIAAQRADFEARDADASAELQSARSALNAE